MLGIPPVALLFCAAAGGFDVNGTVISESRAGEAPLVADGRTQAGVATILTPDVEVQYLGHPFELHLDYALRIFWRHPNEASSDRPLILHTASFSAAVRPARTFRLTSRATLSVGAADYTDLAIALGTPMQAALPQVLDLLAVTGEVGGEVAASRTWSMGIGARITHRRPIGADPSSPGTFALVKQTSVGTTPFVLDRVTRLTDVGLYAPWLYATYDNGARLSTFSPQLSLTTHLGRQSTLRVGAGLAVARVTPIAATPTTLSPGSASTDWGPVGGVEGNLAFLTKHDTAVRLTLGVNVDEFADPILQAAGLRGSTQARVSLLLSPVWACGLEGGFATSLSRYPIAGYPDETSAYASVPFKYRASDEMVVEFGGRWLDRAPHLAAPDFAFHQRQLWLYVILSGTTRRQAPWIGP